MDEMLVELNKRFPRCDYAQIRKYEPAMWTNREYNSKFENKAPMTQWKTTPLDYEQAAAYAEQGYRIAWVVPEGYVVVDIDNEDNPDSSLYVERILNEKGIKYAYNRTSRGIHMLFKDSMLTCPSDAVTKCSIGITVDHRAHHKGYIILPTNDPHRQWGEWPEEIDEIPFWLRPIMNARDLPSFIGMGEGGRNDALYRWRNKLLQANKLTDDEITESLYIINDFLLAEPMGEEEMKQSVTKKRATDDEQREKTAVSKLNVLEKENIYNTIANKISREYDLICFGSRQFYIFDKTYYKELNPQEVERIIHFDVSENIPSHGRKEILDYLALKNYVRPEEVNKIWHRIAVHNGILDVVTGELLEPNKEDRNTIYVPWDYVDDPAYSPAIDEFMNHLAGDQKNGVDIAKKQFLYQIAGYCLLKKNFFGKFFIFQGDGQTGKSTFQDLIVKMLGEENRSRVGIDKMDNDYYLATVFGKLVNIDDDAVDGKVLENTGRFKSLITGNEITCRQVYKEPITFIPFATCMFSCNKLPRIIDKTSGLYRRLIIIELNNKIDNPDPLFLNRLTKRDMEYFLYNAVYWVGIALKEGRFRINQSETDMLRKFRCRQSSVNEWIYEEHMTLGDVYEKSTFALYSLYLDFSQRNGYTKLPSHATFKEDLCALYSLDIKYVSDEKRANQAIFTRNTRPSPEEMEKLPF